MMFTFCPVPDVVAACAGGGGMAPPALLPAPTALDVPAGRPPDCPARAGWAAGKGEAPTVVTLICGTFVLPVLVAIQPQTR
jgi:hypothetical protein